MIAKASFISVWDGQEEIITDCLVNTDTLEVFGIEQAEPEPESGSICTAQYVEINGVDYEVFERDEAAEGDYWYY